MTLNTRMLELEDTLDAALVRISRVERRLDDITPSGAAMTFEQCGRCAVFVSPIGGYVCPVVDCPRRATTT